MITAGLAIECTAPIHGAWMTPCDKPGLHEHQIDCTCGAAARRSTESPTPNSTYRGSTLRSGITTNYNGSGVSRITSWHAKHSIT
jgi:hypothetical protein